MLQSLSVDSLGQGLRNQGFRVVALKRMLEPLPMLVWILLLGQQCPPTKVLTSVLQVTSPSRSRRSRV